MGPRRLSGRLRRLRLRERRRWGLRLLDRLLLLRSLDALSLTGSIRSSSSARLVDVATSVIGIDVKDVLVAGAFGDVGAGVEGGGIGGREKDLANSMGLNIDDFNQRIKVHEHSGNLVLQFLQQHHQTLKPHSPEDDTLQKYHNLKREHELLQAQHSASQRSSPPSTMTAHKDDAELVTPPPVNHSQSSTPASSLPTVSAAALDDVPPQQQPRIIQSLHGMSPPPAKQTTSKLLTMHSTPEDIIKHYSWTSDQPRVYLKQAPTTTTMPSLIKRANHPSRLNGNKSLDPMAAQLLQARQRLPKGDAPTFASMASLWGLEPGYITKLSDKALCLLIVVDRLLTG